METKTRKPRTRKETTPEVAALKNAMTQALKAAWHVEAAKARREKAQRAERGTVERKLEAQRDALLAMRTAVDNALAAITPVG